ncbi:MAG: NAD-glutamate dehydrogenase, partial [Pacificimonas sp.]
MATASPPAPSPTSEELVVRRALFEGALPGEADDLSPAAADRIAKAALSALAVRQPGEAIIDIGSLETEAGRRVTAITVVNDDMPFLVDSLTNALTVRGMGIQRLLHPIVAVTRNKKGEATAINAADENGLGRAQRRDSDVPCESLIYIEADRIGARGRADLEGDLRGVLDDVRAAVIDWRSMLAKLETASQSLLDASIPVPAGDVMEAKAFLDWLASDNFTLLGFAAYRFEGALQDEGMQPEMEEGLGLLADPEFPVWRGAEGFETLPSALRAFMATPVPLLITKANAISRVHRSTYYDVISVKRYDGKGGVCGEYRFVGLFTSVALSTSPDEVPMMRRKIEAVRTALGFDPKSHSGKALTHIIETFPRTDLFLTSAERLADMARGMLSLLDRPRPRLFVRADPFGRFVSAIVYVPRGIYNTGMRARSGAMLEDAFQARLARFDVELRSEGLARVQYYLGTTPGQVPDTDENDLNKRLETLVRGWDEALEAALISRLGGKPGGRLSLTYAGSFSPSYRDQFDAEEAAIDVERLSALK